MSVCGEFNPNSTTSTNCEICYEVLETLETGQTRSLLCSYLIDGRFVIVKLNIKGILTLCEVRVYGLPSDKLANGM